VISAIALEPYRLPLRRPWRSAGGEVGERNGWLVRCEADGLAGYGDCAPLPAAGTEDEATAWGWLCAWRERSLRRSVESALDDLVGDGPRAPAGRYAAECALADLAAQGFGVPLARWLVPGLDVGLDPRAGLSVPVNAALGPLAELTPGDLAACAAEGYRVFKVKLGLGGLEADLNRLADLAPHLPPEGQFRLDANGAWTLAEARQAVAALNALPVEALEEPLRDPNPVDLCELQAAAGFPLALDESIAFAGGWADPAAVSVRRLVLKPAALGGLRGTLALARTAGAAGMEVVVTSLIESAAGLWPTVHLAAAIGSPIPQGLATAGWLATDLGEAPRPRAGRIAIPQVPGGGFRPG
jgi:o-succinylbenzoate synthase